MFATSSSDATSSSAGDHQQDDLHRAGDLADLLRLLAALADRRLDRRADRGRLAGRVRREQRRPDRLEVVGVVEREVERRRQRVRVELLDPLLEITLEVLREALLGALRRAVGRRGDVRHHVELLLERVDLRLGGVAVEEHPQPDLVADVRRARLARAQHRDQDPEQQGRDHDRHDRGDARGGAAAQRPERLGEEEARPGRSR